MARSLRYQVSCRYSQSGRVVFQDVFRGREAIEAFSERQAKLLAATRFRNMHSLSDCDFIKMTAAPLPESQGENLRPAASAPARRPSQGFLFTNPGFNH